MKRRNFLKGILALSVIPVIGMATEKTYSTMFGQIKSDALKSIDLDIWEENPKTAKELYSCINKYCEVLGYSKKAYEEFYLDGKFTRAAHIMYALGAHKNQTIIGFQNREERICRNLWATMRVNIVGSKRDRPRIIWRRIPEYSIDDQDSDISKVSMRLAFIDNHSMGKYLKEEGKRAEML